MGLSRLFARANGGFGKRAPGEQRVVPCFGEGSRRIIPDRPEAPNKHPGPSLEESLREAADTGELVTNSPDLASIQHDNRPTDAESRIHLDRGCVEPISDEVGVLDTALQHDAGISDIPLFRRAMTGEV